MTTKTMTTNVKSLPLSPPSQETVAIFAEFVWRNGSIRDPETLYRVFLAYHIHIDSGSVTEVPAVLAHE